MTWIAGATVGLMLILVGGPALNATLVAFGLALMVVCLALLILQGVRAGDPMLDAFRHEWSGPRDPEYRGP
jgi:hypothetical protein